MKKYNSSIIVTFLGTDGSGKTTLIKKLQKRLKKDYKKIKYIHFRPYFFLNDKRTVISDPHKQKLNKSKIKSLILLLMWLFIYHFYFSIILKKKNQLIIFDRYVHDILIDNKRYGFNLSKKLTNFFLNFFPHPKLWIILKTSINVIIRRKKELPVKELKLQMRRYVEFAKKKITQL